MKEHLLAVLRRNDHDLRRRAADRGNGAFALLHRHAAIGIAEFDDAFEDDERSLSVGADRQRPVGTADGGGCGRRIDDQALAATLGAGPDRTRFQPEIRVARPDLLDAQRGIAPQPYLRVISEEDGQRARCVGAQHVAGKQVLGEVDDPPVGNVDEAHLLAGFAGNDGAGRG